MTQSSARILLPSRLIVAIGIAGALGPLCACSTTELVSNADREVYDIIGKRADVVDGMPAAFTIDATPAATSGPVIFAASPLVLTLPEAIETAVQHSRQYQLERERLYMEALSLTLARHKFDTIAFGRGAASISGDGGDSNNVAGKLAFGLNRMLATGADLSVSLVTNLFRNLSGGDPATAAASALTAELTQPLLQGGGREATLEPLTQAERNMTYAVRDFVRYQRAFSVEIAKRYFAVVRLRDQLENARDNQERLRLERERAELMAQAGMMPAFQVDQTRQNELRARDGVVRAEENLARALDAFKLELGLPVETPLELDRRELERLNRRQAAYTMPRLEDVEDAAVTRRLDLRNAEDAIQDAERRARVLENALQTRLDLRLGYRLGTRPTQPVNFSDQRDEYTAGLDGELPLDRKAQRNAYRQALIAINAARRAHAQRIDEIQLEVRNALRRLAQAETTHRIQKASLELARERVESTSLLQQAGRATARDLLEAQEALLEAQNAVTAALVEQYLAQLDLALAAETLIVDDNGLWPDDQLLGTGAP